MSVKTTINYLGDDGGKIQFSEQTQHTELLNFPQQNSIKHLSNMPHNITTANFIRF